MACGSGDRSLLFFAHCSCSVFLAAFIGELESYSSMYDSEDLKVICSIA